MLEPLFNFFSSVWESTLPFTIVDQEHKALVYRLGIVNRQLKPGFHWTIPYAEEVVATATNTRFTTLSQQSLETKDDIQIVVCAMVQWRVNDIEAAQLKVEGEDVESAVIEASCGAIGVEVRSNTWATLRGPEYFAGLKEPVQKRIQRYGVLVEKVELIDLSRCTVHRVFKDN